MDYAIKYSVNYIFLDIHSHKKHNSAVISLNSTLFNLSVHTL